MSRILVIVPAILGLFCSSAVISSAQGKNPQDGKIVLEEVEFQILQNGKVMESHHLRSAEAEELGKRMRDKGLPKGRSLRAKKLEKPRLRFVDSSGKTKKEIALGWAVETTSASIKTSGSPVAMELKTSRHAELSGDSEKVVVMESRGEPVLGSHGASTSRIEVYDSSGEIRWEKKLPRFMIASRCKLPKKSGRVIVFESWTEFDDLPSNAPIEQVAVYNPDGSELLRYPKEGRDLSLRSPAEVSPGGRYIAISATKDRKDVVLFLDVESGRAGTYKASAFPYSIDDKGIAKLGGLDGSTVEQIDAKEYLQPEP